MPPARAGAQGKGEAVVQRLIKAVVVALACTQAAWAVPVVTLTAPANNASYPSPASITLSAQASDTGDNIAKVEFYVSSALIGAAAQMPYTVNWINVASGSYTITAKATNSAGASAVSDPVTVNVTGAATGGGQVVPVYYIQPDHLNTPRVITDSSNNVVWRWDNTEPFGNNVANENPSGLGTFTYNPRFPGQYFDRETNLHYNYYRDYDPSSGRYIEVDPLGLAGGSLSPYAYVDGNPLTGFDPLGLANGNWASPNSANVPAKPKEENCPDDKCKHTVTVNLGGVCPPGDTTCPQAMQAAGIQPPYEQKTMTLDVECMAKLGITVKGSGAVAGAYAGKYGPGLVARGLSAAGGPTAGAYAGAAGTTLAEISSGPIGITASILGAVGYLAKECECKAGQK